MMAGRAAEHPRRCVRWDYWQVTTLKSREPCLQVPRQHWGQAAHLREALGGL